MLSIGPLLFEIINPITKASVVIPRAFPFLDRCRRYVWFGFDPVDGKHKVLESSYSPSVNRVDHSVCVVSASDSGIWRSIEGPSDVRFSSKQEVCIDGVIYGDAFMKNRFGIMAFDVRSEKFQFAVPPIDFHPCGTYLEFEGKLAIARYPFCYKDNGQKEIEEAVFDLWVLENFEKQVWSSKFSGLPSFASTRQLIGRNIYDELIFVEQRKIKDEPVILPINVHIARYSNLREDNDFSEDGDDVPFTLYILYTKTGNLWSSDVRLPPEYLLNARAIRRITAAPFVERL